MINNGAHPRAGYVQRLLAGTTMADAAADAGGGGGDAAAAAAAAAAKGGGGNGAAWAFPTEKAFAEYLPDTYKAAPAFRDIKTFDGLLSSFVSTQKLVGADKATILQLPKDDDAKAWDGFYNAQGRPEKVEGYKVPARADGKAYDETATAFQKQMIPVLHEIGLTQRQIDKLVPRWNEYMDGNTKAANDKSVADTTAAAAALKTELGMAFDGKLADAQAALVHYAGELKLGDAILKDLDASKLGNHPGMFKLLAHFGAQLKEDGVIGKGGVGGGAGALAPAEAKQQLATMNADEETKKIMLDKTHPKHAETIAKRSALFEQAYPAAQA